MRLAAEAPMPKTPIANAPALTITAADLFCGAGGTSMGLLQAARRLGVEVDLLALNHWQMAITTHAQNHPGRHLWADIQGIHPREVVPEGKLRLLCASPECVFFSRARGGKPINDQRRSSADYIVRWARQLDIEDLLIENVREFLDWGPLYPDSNEIPQDLRLTPIPAQKGTLFQAFIRKLRRCGYRHIEWRVLNAADYGDATSRERLFIRANKRQTPIAWPAPTHPRESWRPAREIIDWSRHGESIYGRKKPLVPATMKRILAGFAKFSGLEPFLVEYHGNHLGTESSVRRHRSLREPLATQDTSNRFGLAQPYLVKLYGGYDAMLIEQALPTITANYQHYGLAEPYLTVLRNHADGQSLDLPLPTLCANGQHVGVSEPFLINLKGQSTAANIDAPLPTQTAHAQHLGIVEPYLVNVAHGVKGKDERAYSVDDTLKTFTAKGQFGVVRPYLTKYYGTGVAASVDAPLDTITTVDRFGCSEPRLVLADDQPEHLLRALDHPDPMYRPRVVCVEGVLYLVDILYRMLQPQELAAAMGFPRSYRFTGTQGDQVRQIGNAVAVNLAEALCRSILEPALGYRGGMN